MSSMLNFDNPAYRFFFAAIYFLLCNPCFPNEFVFASKNEPPYIYSSDLGGNKGAGPMVEIINAVCSKVEINCTVMLFPWPRAQALTKIGETQGIALVRDTNEREGWLYFSPPIVDSEYGFFVQERNRLNYQSAKDINEYKIAVYGPSATEEELHNLLKENASVQIDIQPDIESGFRKLAAGRVDAVFSNMPIGQAIIQRLGLPGLRYAGTEKKFQYFLGFSKKSVSSETVNRFNIAYKCLYLKGEIDSILLKYDLASVQLKDLQTNTKDCKNRLKN